MTAPDPASGTTGGLRAAVEALAERWDRLADGNEAARGRNTKVAAYYRKHAAEIRTALAAHAGDAATPERVALEALTRLSCEVCWEVDYYEATASTVNGIQITAEHRAPGWTSNADGDFCPECAAPGDEGHDEGGGA